MIFDDFWDAGRLDHPVGEDGEPRHLDAVFLVSGWSATALAVTFQVRSDRKVALSVLAVQIQLFTFPPIDVIRVKQRLIHPIYSTAQRQKVPCNYPLSLLFEVRALDLRRCPFAAGSPGDFLHTDSRGTGTCVTSLG